MRLQRVRRQEEPATAVVFWQELVCARQKAFYGFYDVRRVSHDRSGLEIDRNRPEITNEYLGASVFSCKFSEIWVNFYSDDANPAFKEGFQEGPFATRGLENKILSAEIIEIPVHQLLGSPCGCHPLAELLLYARICQAKSHCAPFFFSAFNTSKTTSQSGLPLCLANSRISISLPGHLASTNSSNSKGCAVKYE